MRPRPATRPAMRTDPAPSAALHCSRGSPRTGKLLALELGDRDQKARVQRLVDVSLRVRGEMESGIVAHGQLGIASLEERLEPREQVVDGPQETRVRGGRRLIARQ